MEPRYEPLSYETLPDVVCLPGKLELANKRMIGDINQVRSWRQKMLEQGLQGVIAYLEDTPRGFAEFIAADRSPTPIIAPGAAVLMCYHWAGTDPEDPEHLAREERLVDKALCSAEHAGFSGMATLGWDHPTHFPIALLRELGFRELSRQGDIALLWKPFRRGACTPGLAASNHVPADLSPEGRLAVDIGYSTRCPYSIHHTVRVRSLLDAHPQRGRIQLEVHAVDTRQQALAVCPRPCDWWWIRFNGKEVGLFSSREQLEHEIRKHLPEGPTDGSPSN